MDEAFFFIFGLAHLETSSAYVELDLRILASLTFMSTTSLIKFVVLGRTHQDPSAPPPTGPDSLTSGHTFTLSPRHSRSSTFSFISDPRSEGHL